MSSRFATLRVLGLREPLLLHTGQSISVLGDGIANVALALLVLDTTRSPSMLGWFAAARMTPTVLFLLLGGAIVDRVSRRFLLLVSDVGRALLTGVLVTLLITHQLRFVDLLLFAFTFGAFDALFMPAVTALIPELVSAELLGAMNANRAASNTLLGNMLGPAVGGVLAAFSTTWAMGVDALTFVASSTTLLLMRPTDAPAREHATSMIHEIREGLRYFRSTLWFWTTLVGVTISNAFVFTPMVIVMTYLLRHDFHTSKQIVGYTFAIGGLAGGVGALVSGNFRVPRRRVRVMWTMWLVADLSSLLIAFATNYWWVMIAQLLASPLLILGNVIWESMMQSEVPRDLLGRASSVDWFISLGLAPVGLATAGAFIAAWGVRRYLVVATIVSALPGVLILLSRRVNRFDEARLAEG